MEYIGAVYGKLTICYNLFIHRWIWYCFQRTDCRSGWNCERNSGHKDTQRSTVYTLSPPSLPPHYCPFTFLALIGPSLSHHLLFLLITSIISNLHDLYCFMTVGVYDREAVRDMLRECSKMKNFDHRNVLTLRGVCLDGGPAPFIIMPFMSNGSLLHYLKNNRGALVVSRESKDEEDVSWCSW